MSCARFRWKEVAAYLGKGVRTVQRWERELSLPVRRPYGVEKHVIVALPEELDEWVHTRMRPRQEQGGVTSPEAHASMQSMQSVQRLQRLMSLMLERAEVMNRRCAELIAHTEALRKGTSETRRLRALRSTVDRERPPLSQNN